MKFGRLFVALVAALACLALSIPSAQSQADRPDDAVSIYQVFVNDQADVDALVSSGVDLVESRGPDFLLVIGDADVAAQLRDDGFRVREERQLNPLAGVGSAGPGAADFSARSATYYGGYRTVDEHVAHLGEVEAAYPGLAKVVDYGNSWRRVNAQPDGNDLLAICLTNRQAGDCELNPNAPKPRAVIMAAIHARELQTSEIAWRLIDELTEEYGADADITHIMDTTEVWVIPVANPDGREIVEGGGNSPYLQRKNANDTFGDCAIPPTASNHHGVDLNRNSSHYWGGIGTSPNPCDQTYPGTSAASEPEQSSLETLFFQLFQDQRSSEADPAPATATGTFISMHSYGELILLPSGDGSGALNDAELRAFAFRMSHFNDYIAGTASEILYNVSGTTDEWAYGELGVASFTYELSPIFGTCSGFTPAYSCIDSSIWPRNRDALLYSLKVAGAPYVTPQGPTTVEVRSAASVAVGSTLNVRATVDDDALGNAAGSVGRPTAAAVTEVEYYLDVAPSQGGTPVAMSAVDGSFDSASELAEATIDSSALAVGDHTIYVRGRNAAGFWGAVTAANFTVRAAGNLGPFSCKVDGDRISWPDHFKTKYWVYRSLDGGATWSWFGRTTGATEFVIPTVVPGALYQVHYAMTPRVDCTVISDPNPEPSEWVIEAEDYFRAIDTEPGNQGPATQFIGDADVWPKPSGDGYVVGRIRQGESTSYKVRIETPGSYRFAVSAASGIGGGTVTVRVGGVKVGQTTALGTTGGWWNYVDTDMGSILLDAQQYVVTVQWGPGQSNFDKFTITSN